MLVRQNVTTPFSDSENVNLPILATKADYLKTTIKALNLPSRIVSFNCEESEHFLTLNQ